MDRDSFFAALSESERKDSRFEVSAVMSDSDRQLYFADFVIELQAAEDDKRRRIRDARRRAEKAQREAFRDALRKMATDGNILPATRWRAIEGIIATDSSYKPVQAQDQDSPRELFEEFVDEWGELYRRERSLLSRTLHPTANKEIVLKETTTYEAFTKLLLDEAAYSPELYGETRRIINREEPISSARLYYDELILRAKEGITAVVMHRGSAGGRGSQADSSEDEGEIIEDGEVPGGEVDIEMDKQKETAQNREASKDSEVESASENNQNDKQDIPEAGDLSHTISADIAEGLRATTDALETNVAAEEQATISSENDQGS
jgi:pre-mRNA-processing factor 40